MVAHEVKGGTKVTVTDERVYIPVGTTPVKNGDIITINKVDGMYCNGTDKDGNSIYISAWTEVELYN